ncbi:MAG: PAS domain S-box protein [Planctomycetota bacterium]|nr:PAS domain S-box protein [Planctomycetota bacterium]
MPSSATDLDAILPPEQRRLLDLLPDFALVLDSAGTILYVNATVPEFSRQSVIGKKAIDLTREAERGAYLKAIRTVLKTRQPFTMEGVDINGRAYLNRLIPLEGGKRAYYVLVISTEITERKKMEEDLRSNRAFVDRIAQTSPHIMYVFNIPLRTNVYANRQIARDLGYGVKDVQRMGGKFLAKLLHPDDQARASEHLKGWDAVPDGVVREFEYRMRHKDGTWRWFLGRDAVFSRDERGQVVEIIGTAQEIHARKMAEEMIQASENRLSAIVENTPNVAIQSYDQDGRVLTWNSASEKMFGFRAREAVGKTLDKLIHTPEEARAFRETLQQIKPDHALGPNEYDFRRRDGTSGVCLSTIFEIPSMTEKRNFICMDVDITDRKKAEGALRESEQRNRTLVEYAPEAVVVFDVSLQRFVDVNEVATKLFCCSREELLTKGPVELSAATAPDGRPSGEVAKEVIGRTLKGETPVFEWTHMDVFGREIATEVRLVRLPASGRQLVRGSIIDIGERKRLEEQLRQIQKVESIGRLAGGVAHDFNNLLTSILGFTDLAILAVAGDASTVERLERVRESALRGARLTQQLLAFARRQVIHPQVVDLRALLAQMSEMLDRLIGEDVDLKTIAPPTLGRVKVDLGQLEQVLMNMAINARDAMPNGGELVIEADNVVLDEEYAQAHLEVKAGPYVEIAVTDTGMGIEPEIRKHIFEPFFTTKPAGKGTGLGLSTCYGIVKQSGGHITVYSEVGRGTTFKIYLPRTDEGAREPMTEHNGSLSATGSETVLLVEDDEMIRTLATEVLVMKGYQVLCAEDGVDALAKIRAQQGEIHLIITDVVMPKMGGHELAEIVSKERPKVRILYTSGYSENSIANGALTETSHFIQKPYTPTSLARKVREILDAP